MQNKITFESVLKECGFELEASLRWGKLYLLNGKDFYIRCAIDLRRKKVSIERNWHILPAIYSPLRLKVLLDILLETHGRPTSE